MCVVVEFKTGKIALETMSLNEAEALVGGYSLDELYSTRDLCVDDPKVVEACDILIARLTA